MTNEITQAFDHPEHRARATASPMLKTGEFPDRISVRDHIVTVEIGAFQVERNVTQRLAFNIVVEVGPVHVPLEDDVDNILSYDRVTEAIATELAAERLNLLETLASRIAQRILLEPQAIRVFIRIEKLDRGSGALGVEIVRVQGQSDAVNAEKNPSPVIVFLPENVLQHAGLPIFFDQLIDLPSPVILAVSPPQQVALAAGHPAAQIHVDLLAIEQNAWLLAGHEARVKVVSTRTELDWAIKQKQFSVWAPSKLILSHVDLARISTQPLDLAVWLSGELAAKELIVVDHDAPQTDFPTRRISMADTL